MMVVRVGDLGGECGRRRGGWRSERVVGFEVGAGVVAGRWVGRGFRLRCGVFQIRRGRSVRRLCRRQDLRRVLRRCCSVVCALCFDSCSVLAT